jgi:hypothetical protein
MGKSMKAVELEAPQLDGGRKIATTPIDLVAGVLSVNACGC